MEKGQAKSDRKDGRLMMKSKQDNLSTEGERREGSVYIVCTYAQG